MPESSSNPVPMLTFVHASIQYFLRQNSIGFPNILLKQEHQVWPFNCTVTINNSSKQRFFFSFFFNTIKKSTLLQDVCCHWGSLLPKPTEMKCFFPKRLQQLLKSLYRVQELLNQHLSECPCFHQIQQLIQSLFSVYLNAIIPTYILYIYKPAIHTSMPVREWERAQLPSCPLSIHKCFFPLLTLRQARDMVWFGVQYNLSAL